MDFHNLKRKALLALCKKHSIPGVGTNLELADQLSSLLKPKDDKGSKIQSKKARLGSEQVDETVDLKKSEDAAQPPIRTTRSRRGEDVLPMPPPPPVEKKKPKRGADAEEKKEISRRSAVSPSPVEKKMTRRKTAETERVDEKSSKDAEKEIGVPAIRSLRNREISSDANPEKKTIEPDVVSPKKKDISPRKTRGGVSLGLKNENEAEKVAPSKTNTRKTTRSGRQEDDRDVINVQVGKEESKHASKPEERASRRSRRKDTVESDSLLQQTEDAPPSSKKHDQKLEEITEDSKASNVATARTTRSSRNAEVTILPSSQVAPPGVRTRNKKVEEIDVIQDSKADNKITVRTTRSRRVAQVVILQSSQDLPRASNKHNQKVEEKGNSRDSKVNNAATARTTRSSRSEEVAIPPPSEDPPPGFKQRNQEVKGVQNTQVSKATSEMPVRTTRSKRGAEVAVLSSSPVANKKQKTTGGMTARNDYGDKKVSTQSKKATQSKKGAKVSNPTSTPNENKITRRATTETHATVKKASATKAIGTRETRSLKNKEIPTSVVDVNYTKKHVSLRKMSKENENRKKVNEVDAAPLNKSRQTRSRKRVNEQDDTQMTSPVGRAAKRLKSTTTSTDTSAVKKDDKILTCTDGNSIRHGSEHVSVQEDQEKLINNVDTVALDVTGDIGHTVVGCDMQGKEALQAASQELGAGGAGTESSCKPDISCIVEVPETVKGELVPDEEGNSVSTQSRLSEGDVNLDMHLATDPSSAEGIISVPDNGSFNDEGQDVGAQNQEETIKNVDTTSAPFNIAEEKSHTILDPKPRDDAALPVTDEYPTISVGGTSADCNAERADNDSFNDDGQDVSAQIQEDIIKELDTTAAATCDIAEEQSHTISEFKSPYEEALEVTEELSTIAVGHTSVDCNAEGADEPVRVLESAFEEPERVEGVISGDCTLTLDDDTRNQEELLVRITGSPQSEGRNLGNAQYENHGPTAVGEASGELIEETTMPGVNYESKDEANLSVDVNEKTPHISEAFGASAVDVERTVSEDEDNYGADTQENVGDEDKLVVSENNEGVVEGQDMEFLQQVPKALVSPKKDAFSETLENVNAVSDALLNSDEGLEEDPSDGNIGKNVAEAEFDTPSSSLKGGQSLIRLEYNEGVVKGHDLERANTKDAFSETLDEPLNTYQVLDDSDGKLVENVSEHEAETTNLIHLENNEGVIEEHGTELLQQVPERLVELEKDAVTVAHGIFSAAPVELLKTNLVVEEASDRVVVKDVAEVGGAGVSPISPTSSPSNEKDEVVTSATNFDLENEAHIVVEEESPEQMQRAQVVLKDLEKDDSTGKHAGSTSLPNEHVSAKDGMVTGTLVLPVFGGHEDDVPKEEEESSQHAEETPIVGTHNNDDGDVGETVAKDLTGGATPISEDFSPIARAMEMDAPDLGENSEANTNKAEDEEQSDHVAVSDKDVANGQDVELLQDGPEELVNPRQNAVYDIGGSSQAVSDELTKADEVIERTSDGMVVGGAVQDENAGVSPLSQAYSPIYVEDGKEVAISGANLDFADDALTVEGGDSDCALQAPTEFVDLKNDAFSEKQTNSGYDSEPSAVNKPKQETVVEMISNYVGGVNVVVEEGNAGPSALSQYASPNDVENKNVATSIGCSFDIGRDVDNVESSKQVTDGFNELKDNRCDILSPNNESDQQISEPHEQSELAEDDMNHAPVAGNVDGEEAVTAAENPECEEFIFVQEEEEVVTAEEEATECLNDDFVEEEGGVESPQQVPEEQQMNDFLEMDGADYLFKSGVTGESVRSEGERNITSAGYESSVKASPVSHEEVVDLSREVLSENVVPGHPSVGSDEPFFDFDELVEGGAGSSDRKGGDNVAEKEGYTGCSPFPESYRRDNVEGDEHATRSGADSDFEINGNAVEGRTNTTCIPEQCIYMGSSVLNIPAYVDSVRNKQVFEADEIREQSLMTMISGSGSDVNKDELNGGETSIQDPSFESWNVDVDETSRGSYICRENITQTECHETNRGSYISIEKMTKTEYHEEVRLVVNEEPRGVAVDDQAFSPIQLSNNIDVGEHGELTPETHGHVASIKDEEKRGGSYSRIGVSFDDANLREENVVEGEKEGIGAEDYNTISGSGDGGFVIDEEGGDYGDLFGGFVDSTQTHEADEVYDRRDR